MNREELFDHDWGWIKSLSLRTPCRHVAGTLDTRYYEIQMWDTRGGAGSWNVIIDNDSVLVTCDANWQYLVWRQRRWWWQYQYSHFSEDGAEAAAPLAHAGQPRRPRPPLPAPVRHQHARGEVVMVIMVITVRNKFGSQNSVNCFVFSYVNISVRGPWTRLSLPTILHQITSHEPYRGESIPINITYY